MPKNNLTSKSVCCIYFQRFRMEVLLDIPLDELKKKIEKCFHTIFLNLTMNIKIYVNEI